MTSILLGRGIYFLWSKNKPKFSSKKKKAAKAAFFGFTQLTLSGLRSLPDFSAFVLDGK
jgi:hypothetical protein